MPESVQAAAERGIDISAHVARRLTEPMIERADLVDRAWPRSTATEIATGSAPRLRPRRSR